MRAIVLSLIVTAVLGAAGVGWQRGAFVRASGLGPQASAAVAVEGVNPAVAGGAVTAPSEGAGPMEEQSADGTPADGPAGSPFYQWVDDRGSVHFVASLEEVPAAWRSRAGRVELDPAAFTRTATPAAKPRRAGNVVEVAASARGHDVTVYTAPWCGWCRKTLAFLDERGVDYVNKDIESDARYAEELREKSGGMGIPFVEIDGATIRGFDPGAMVSLLD